VKPALLVAVLLSFVVLTSLPTLPAFSAMGHDSGIFALGGRMLGEGKVPYRDFWDHKPPMVFVFDGLGLATGLGRLGIWLVELAFVASGLAAFFLALDRRLGTIAAACGAIFFALTLRQETLYQGGNQLEVYTAALSLGVLAVAIRQPAGLGWWVLAGVLSGLNGMTKPSTFGVPVAVGLSLLADFRAKPGRIPAFVGGGAIVVASVLVWLAAEGVLRDFWSANIDYSSLYVAHVSRQEDIGPVGSSALIAWLLAKQLLVPTLAVVACGLVLVSRRDPGPEPRRMLAAIMLLGLAGDLALAYVPRRFYGHYLIAILPSLSLGVALLASAAMELFPKRRLAAALPALLLSVAPLVGVIGLALGARRVPAGDPSVLEALARTPADRPIFIWGAQTQYYFLAERSPPTRYVFLYPLQMPGYGSPARTAELLSDLERRPPSVILDASPKDDSVVPSIRAKGPTHPWALSGYEYVAFDTLYAWIEKHYARKTLENGWDLYIER
jgi:hypothetical protein